MSISLKNDTGTFSTNLNQSNPTENVNIALPATSGTMAKVEDVIGVNQTWQDVTASRAVNTSYNNTSGKPIQVSIRMFVAVASTNIKLNVSGITVQQFSSTAWMANSYISVSAIVPNHTSYDLAIITGVVTIQTWVELR